MKQNDSLKVYLPHEILIRLMLEIHQTYGHVGTRKVYWMLYEDFYAFKLRYNIRKKLKFCDSCQRTKCLNQLLPIKSTTKFINP